MKTGICTRPHCKWEGPVSQCSSYPGTVVRKVDGTTTTETSYYCPGCGWPILRFEDPIHYEEFPDQKRLRLRSSGDFRSGALCGNGAPIEHLRHTHDVDEVTCADCLLRIRRGSEAYYRSS